MNNIIKYGLGLAAVIGAYYVGKAVGAYTAEESFSSTTGSTETETDTETVSENVSEGE